MLDLNNLPKNGTKVMYNLRGANFPMEITSARVRYGQIDVELSPVNGSGSFWVRASSLEAPKTATETIAAL